MSEVPAQVRDPELEQPRGNVLASFGEKEFSALSDDEREIVYGVLFGGAAPALLKNRAEWVALAQTSAAAATPTRKDVAFAGFGYFLGLLGEKDKGRARELWLQAVGSYESNAAYGLGICYGRGVGGCEMDPHKAQEYMEKAVAMGHLEAHYVRGRWLQESFGCSENDMWGVLNAAQEGGRLFWEGEKQKHQGCRRRFAMCYWHGRGVSLATGVEHDFAEAFKLLRQCEGEPLAVEALATADKRGYVKEEEERKKRYDEARRKPVEHHHRYAVGSLREQHRVLGTCVQCGGQLLEGQCNTVTGKCSKCDTALMRLRTLGTSACSECFQTRTELFSKHQMQQVEARCWVCSSETGLDLPLEEHGPLAALLKAQGNVFFKKERFDLACKAYSKAVQLVPDSQAYRANLIAALYMHKRYYSCWQQCQLFLSRPGADPKMRVFAGRASRELGLMEEARQHFAASGAGLGGDWALLRDVEQVSNRMDCADPPLAHSTYHTAPQLVKDNESLRVKYMHTLDAMGRLEEAQVQATHLLQGDLLPEARALATFVEARGQLYCQPSPALSHIVQQLQTAQQTTQTPKLISRITDELTLIAKVQAVEAAADPLAALLSLPAHPLFDKSVRMAQLLLSIATLCLQRNDAPAAVNLVVRSLVWPAAAPKLVATTLQRAGAMAEQQQELDDALQYYSLYLDVVHSSTASYEDVLYSRAALHQQMGMWPEAKRDWQRLLELRPNCVKYQQERRHARYMKKVQLKQLPPYYALLGVNFNATRKEIKKAFKALALETHPDKQTEQEAVESTKQFHAISEAYLTLYDDEKRREYDLQWRVLESGPSDQDT